VVINDVLPAGYTFVSSTPSVGTYNSGTGVWTIGNLANGATATLDIVVTVNATGSYANTATISGNETDPTPGNNTSTSTPVPVNNAPTANDDAFTMAMNTTLNANASTNDVLITAGNPHTYTLVSGGTATANGTLLLNTDGTFTYTPNTGFNGVVSFTYQVCNQFGQCDDATVSITVLPPPTANDDTNTTALNTPVNGGVSANDVLPAGGTYTFTVTTPPNPAEGTVVMNPDGTYTFTPATGFTGTATFTYQVCNQFGQCSTATVTITIGQPPVAVDDTYNTGTGIPVNGNVGTNDQNPSGGATTFTLVSGGTATQNGTLVLNPDGTFTYTPNNGFVGTVTFTYQICNPVGCSQATVTINIAPAVVAVDDSYTIAVDNPITDSLYVNDILPAGSIPVFSLVNGGTAADNGTLVVNPNGTFTFTPNNGVVGTVTFTYQVCNQFGQCSTATVTITIIEPTVIIPEGFSPNNDGTNDFFIIKGRNGRPLVLKIYNRWGNLVYENGNYEDNWNGLSNVGIRIGEQLPDGTYFYTAEFKDNGERYARYLTIKR
jgi:gliding motility-associated-like protein